MRVCVCVCFRESDSDEEEKPEPSRSPLKKGVVASKGLEPSRQVASSSVASNVAKPVGRSKMSLGDGIGNVQASPGTSVRGKKEVKSTSVIPKQANNTSNTLNPRGTKRARSPASASLLSPSLSPVALTPSNNSSTEKPTRGRNSKWKEGVRLKRVVDKMPKGVCITIAINTNITIAVAITKHHHYRHVFFHCCRHPYLIAGENAKRYICNPV